MLRLYKNIFQTNTPARDLQSTLLATYMLNGNAVKGSLLDRVIKAGCDPLKIILDKQPFSCSNCDVNRKEDGMTDSLKFLLQHNDYNKPWSEEHILVTFLTKAY